MKPNPPTIYSLYEELKRLCYYGVSCPPGRLTAEDFPGLVSVGHAVLRDQGQRHKWMSLRSILFFAVAGTVARSQTGDAHVMGFLFGVPPDLALPDAGPRVSVPIRRRAAAKALGYKPDYFERDLEKPLMREFAGEMLLILGE